MNIVNINQFLFMDRCIVHSFAIDFLDQGFLNLIYLRRGIGGYAKCLYCCKGVHCLKNV